MYLKKAQSEKPCLYEIPYDTSDLANRFSPDREETLTLEKENAHTELQCLYQHKVKECECLAQNLSNKPETVCKVVYNEFSRRFAKLEKHSISLELALQHCQEQMTHEKNIAISELKKLIDKMKGKGVDTNFEKPSILEKPPLQAISKKPLVRQPSAYKSERSQFPKHWFASQVDVSNDLKKPVTPHSWPQDRKSSFAKPYDVNAPDPSRNSPNHVSFQSPRESVGSKDMVHNYYLEEAKKKAQLQKDKTLNTKPSVQQSARFPNTANGNKLKPRNFNQQPKNWPPSMSRRVSNRTKKDAESHKTTKRYILVEKKSDSKNHGRWILIGQRFSPNKSSNVYLKTTPSRSGLTWKPSGRIFTQVGLKWIPIRKSVETCHNTNDSASPLGNEDENPARANIKQALDAPVTRTTSAAVKPCQEDSTEFYLRLYGGGDIPSQLRSIHHHMLMLKLQRHTLSIKIQESRRLKLKDKDFRKL
ncbi:hypothetical protein Tco_0439141 [Tanacetum coccineum]